MIAQISSTATAACPTEVLAALETASRKTGSDFSYLLATAQRESNLDSKAKSKSSSATGLFQFIDQTWLGLVKQFGERYGLGQFSGAITQTETGRYAVASKDTKSAILALREDPEISSLMAGEAAAQTRQSLECALGRKLCDGELYAAHFLGEGGARQLIRLNEQSPEAAADVAFAQAAKANRSVFYHADGTAKSVREVYTWAVSQHANSAAPVQPIGPKPTLMAAADNVAIPYRTARGSWHATHTPSQAPSLASRGHAHALPTAQHPVAAYFPRSPLQLGPGVLELIAALAPAAPSLAARQA